MDNNKVTVKIFGQEYTIMGSKSREHIIKVADHVDVKMKEISQALNSGPVSSIAVLAAVNVADDYFSALSKFEGLEAANIQAEKDIAHYIQLWEEAKKNHMQYQEELKTVSAEREQLLKRVNEQEAEIKKLKEDSAKIEGQMMESSSGIVNELEAKYKDLESSFFDIQMENIQLKGELDRYKKKME